jgi:hypothetical protein
LLLANGEGSVRPTAHCHRHARAVWPNPAEAALDGVFTIRTRDDAARL